MKHPLNCATITRKFTASHLIADDRCTPYQLRQHRKIARIVDAHRASIVHKVEETWAPRETKTGPENWYTVTITHI